MRTDLFGPTEEMLRRGEVLWWDRELQASVSWFFKICSEPQKDFISQEDYPGISNDPTLINLFMHLIDYM